MTWWIKYLMKLIRYRTADILRGRLDLPHRVNIAEKLDGSLKSNKCENGSTDKDILSIRAQVFARVPGLQTIKYFYLTCLRQGPGSK